MTSNSNTQSSTNEIHLEKQPSPEKQRQAVLGIHAIAVNNAALFHKTMIEEGFPSDRLLTPQFNSLSPIPGLNNFQTESMIFNTRFQYHPFAIVMCESTSEVQQAYNTAISYNLPIRVRSGGHDHAGECSGDNVVLIDVTGIKNFSLSDDGIATIGAGYRFYQLTPLLAEQNRMIAHGTCATVGLTGYIQGGGWGPWTRKHGMSCEHLVGASIVLGDGTKVEVSENENSDLFWAIRGGGGMSYGIITELKIQTFALPDVIHRFEIEWNKPAQMKPSESYCTPEEKETTLDVLQQWEAAILSEETPKLVGTNLKINATPKGNTDFDVNNLYHHCLMYGYWEGTKQELQTFIHNTFSNVSSDQITIDEPHGAGCKQKYDHQLMGHWARNSLYDVSKRLGIMGTLAHGGTPFPPDYDAPAPHKLTSRLVCKEGLSPTGHEQLIQSLTSSLLSLENEQQGLFSYVTLGAIRGEFYQTDENLADIAFPYRDCQYTIQYQTWWNEDIQRKIELQNNTVYVDVNRAMDWIDTSRENTIENTKGSFISFKDPAIPTEIYFGESYHCLVKVKKTYVKDEFNHLRSRKTII